MEMWRTVFIEFKATHYSVSDHGRVRNNDTNKFLKPRSHTGGYKIISLYIDSKEYRFYIHRLVMLTFKPIRVGDENQVNHIDGNKENNHLYNLEWCNNSQNQKHAHRIGLKKTMIGEDVNTNKYPESTIYKICELIEQGYYNTDISNILGINNPDIVSSIRKKRIWRHISDKFIFKDDTRDFKGENNPSSKHSSELINEICLLIDKEFSNGNIQKMLGLPSSNIVSKIRRGKLWRSISSNYKFMNKV